MGGNLVIPCGNPQFFPVLVGAPTCAHSVAAFIGISTLLSLKGVATTGRPLAAQGRPIPFAAVVPPIGLETEICLPWIQRAGAHRWVPIPIVRWVSRVVVPISSLAYLPPISICVHVLPILPTKCTISPKIPSIDYNTPACTALH